jgi:hypothetical protein
LFGTFVSALPHQTEAITTHFNELPDALTVDAMGMFVLKWGSEGSADGQLKRPSGVAVSDGLVYVADSNNHRIQVFNTSDGRFVRKWGSKGSAIGQLELPRGVAISTGLLYVADSYNHRIQVFKASDGSFVRTWGNAESVRNRRIGQGGVRCRLWQSTHPGVPLLMHARLPCSITSCAIIFLVLAPLCSFPSVFACLGQHSCAYLSL